MNKIIKYLYLLREPLQKERLSTNILVVQTSLERLLLILKTLFTFCKTSYLIEVNVP
jgi:hypothetical protein